LRPIISRRHWNRQIETKDVYGFNQECPAVKRGVLFFEFYIVNDARALERILS